MYRDLNLTLMVLEVNITVINGMLYTSHKGQVSLKVHVFSESLSV